MLLIIYYIMSKQNLINMYVVHIIIGISYMNYKQMVQRNMVNKKTQYASAKLIYWFPL